MTRNRNKQRKNVSPSNGPQPKTNNDGVLDQGLKSCENLISETKENSGMSELANKLKSAIESSNDATSEQKQVVAEKLEENISQLVGELKKLLNDTKNADVEYKSKLNQVNQKEKSADEKNIEIDRDRKQLDLDKKSLINEKKEVADQKADLADRFTRLEEKEIEAERGFSSKHEEMLKKYQKDKEKESEIFEARKDSIQSSIVELQKKQIQLEKNLEQEHANILARIHSKEVELQHKENELEEAEEVIQRAKSRLSRRENAIEESYEQQREEIRQEFRFELDQKDGINESLTAQIKKYKELQDSHRAEINTFKNFQETLGGEDPIVIFERLEDLQKSNRELQQKIDLKPSDDLEHLYNSLLEEKQNLETVLAKKEQELSRESRLASQLRISAVAQEVLEQEKLTLTKANQVLKDRHKQLRQEVDDAMADQESKSPFPTLLDMDNGLFKDDRGKVDHRREKPSEAIPNLKHFVSELSHRIAWDKNTKKELYYSEADIRIFVAGLSMSRLHILQGISGTGKTSLPLAFARAVGGHCKTVAVQAGWRDKDDLVGHYNSFEKKFYERSCLEGLYEAQTPLFRNRPYIILLDEMNLSRPEQYFSEFLSAMEQDKEKQFLELMTESVKGSPVGFTNGRALRIPENVWFIGTANHDETTYEFADKTYDRSHVMELPRHEESFAIKKDLGNVVYNYESLEDSFKKAANEYGARVSESLETIYKSDLVKHLREDLEVSWGNRFERQAQNFVSTLIASGGEESTAFDHLLATKVFRSGKATGRYDTEKEDIDNVRLALDVLWSDMGFSNPPLKSIGLLDKELRRKGS